MRARTAAAAVVVVSKICAVHAFSTGSNLAAPPPVLQTSSSSLVSDASARLDPLLTSFLLRSVREVDEDEGEKRFRVKMESIDALFQENKTCLL